MNWTVTWTGEPGAHTKNPMRKTIAFLSLDGGLI